MTAYGFGRKGVAGGAVAPRRASLVSAPQPRSFQPMRDATDPEDGAEQRRAAFLADERAQRPSPRRAAPICRRPRRSRPWPRSEANRWQPPTVNSLKAAYAIWFFLGLGGGHVSTSAAR